MKREINITEDGSHTISIPEMNVTYHSTYGAMRESLHVFIEAGLHFYLSQNPGIEKMKVLEMGFGTGLNALLTLVTAGESKIPVYYESIEAYPLEPAITSRLNYGALLQQPDAPSYLEQLHNAPWNEVANITAVFELKKSQCELINFSSNEVFNVVYYDAFAPNAQPELWTADVFKKIANLLVEGGILVTYCSKGSARRAMREAGLRVKKLPGPPGKWEMVRAVKNALNAKR